MIFFIGAPLSYEVQKNHFNSKVLQNIHECLNFNKIHSKHMCLLCIQSHQDGFDLRI